ncbi:TetR/AcrR family transcriptional regulator [Pseudomonas sp. PDNC002]|uniref:TetR/AcrR family transcriptional regulator n=1 Tax=Pseudomonas sp. PDNC002 TaxID=2811422 RepID=UPI001963FA86|nr:TetR/AcrR family transcriptional regulator [Pseudomonas sp. PDNC002]QRY77261.1 TetR/AcrR family transcriptional regulator [Pseudomonas sp. PDNC002]
MPRKSEENQPDSRRLPRQARALEKVELILEASRRILDRHGLEGFTTNHVAELAGVSVGTLYQYFPNKERILDELARRELAQLSGGIMAALTGRPPETPGERIRAVIHAAVSAYGGRTGAHKALMQYLLTRGGGSPLPTLRGNIMAHLISQGLVGANQQPRVLAEAEAFVLAHAVSGVLRAMLDEPETLAPGRREGIEEALVQLVLGYYWRPSAGTATA